MSFTVAYSESRDRLIGNFWGLVAGFTSTHIHAGGPPISIYLLPKQLDKVVLIGTLAMFFAVMNFIKLVPYSLLGQFNTINLWTSVVLMPLAPIGVSMGFWLLHHVKQEVLYRVIYVFLFGSGVKLVYDGLLNLVV
ncbi:MAG: sulfite exporter TauE/SafE family protein [Glaciecola sp.]